MSAALCRPSLQALHKGPSAAGCEAAPPRDHSVQAGGPSSWRHTLGFGGRRVSPQLRKLSVAAPFGALSLTVTFTASFGAFFPTATPLSGILPFFCLAVPGLSLSTQGLR